MFDLNSLHQEWLASMTMNRHGVASFDFATVSGCNQLVVSPTQACSETLDLLTTDVPDLVWVAIVVPIAVVDNLWVATPNGVAKIFQGGADSFLF